MESPITAVKIALHKMCIQVVVEETHKNLYEPNYCTMFRKETF